MEYSLVDEVADVDFGDRRLTGRLVQVISTLGERPNLSLPAALGGRADLEAAYRFFANEKVTPQAILAKHYEASLGRLAQRKVSLLIQDTTEIDLTRPSRQVAGAGPMDSENRRGAFAHVMMAADPEGIPLGLVWSKLWTREAISTTETAEQKCQRIKQLPIEEKESIRWIEGMRAARELASRCTDTECICITDSEGDIYEMLSEPRCTGQGPAVQLLVRACQNRRLSESASRLLEAVKGTPLLYTCALPVSARQPKTAAETRKRRTQREARTAHLEVRKSTVTLRPPHRPDRQLSEVTVHVVLVDEVDAPQGSEPIRWLLITTLPIETDEQVQLIVHYYCQRWGIEVYFKTVKSGCRIEERQFEYLDRELNCVAVYLIVAWRVMLLCRLGRSCPDLDCEVVFEPSEWQAVYMIVHNKKPPQTPLKFNDMIKLVASLGGYVQRKNSLPPGTQTLWIGMQRMYDLALAWDLYGPGRK